MTTQNVETLSTPNLDRMVTVRDQSMTAGEFIDWLREEKGIGMGRFARHRNIHVDRHYQHLVERENAGDIDFRTVLASIVTLDTREFDIAGMVDDGLMAPECWGLDPDCPDIDDERHRKPSWVVAECLDVESLLYEFFDIDRAAANRERDAVYRSLKCGKV